MAGTLTISTLSDGTNSTSSTNCIKGSAKAWGVFVGSTAVVSASYNLSSITRTSSGIYVANFTNALSSANYSSTGNSTVYGSTSSAVSIVTFGSASNTTWGPRSTTQLGVNTYIAGTGYADPDQVSFAVFN